MCLTFFWLFSIFMFNKFDIFQFRFWFRFQFRQSVGAILILEIISLAITSIHTLTHLFESLRMVKHSIVFQRLFRFIDCGSQSYVYQRHRCRQPDYFRDRLRIFKITLHSLRTSLINTWYTHLKNSSNLINSKLFNKHKYIKIIIKIVK